MKIFLSEWMQELDAKTIDLIGIPSIVLMENASSGAALFFKEIFPFPEYKNVLVFIGKGNNGGDGMAVGRILAQRGYKVEFVFLFNPENLKPDPLINFNIIKNLKLNYRCDDNLKGISEVLDQYNKDNTFIIDAIFGTGLNKPVAKGFFREVIKKITDSGYRIAAIDLPSGISEKFPFEKETFVKADCTATFQYLKLAHIHPDGNKYCGKVKVIDIGIPKSLLDNRKYYINITEPDDFKGLFTKRPKDAHKGDFGHCFNIAGSLDKPGAGILCAYAALKSGAGLSTCAVIKENRSLNVLAHPELMEFIYSSTDELKDQFNNFDCILAGPGLGNNKDTLKIISALIQTARVPVILDADALNVLAGKTSMLKQKQGHPVILTPHPGEFSRLINKPVSEIQNNRIAYCRDFAQKNKVFVLLKGHYSVISTPEGLVYLNPTGNPGMATAGSGDVLSGIISGLTAQYINKFPLLKILLAAAFIHGYAGDLCLKEQNEISLTASDLTQNISEALNKINDYQSEFQFSE